MKKLSVIVVAYNAERTIERCINSVLGCDGCELVVVDDASTDGTARILRKYADRIRLRILGENCGSVAKTRNIGLAGATGEFFTFLDADDYYEDGAAQRLIALLRRYDADIVKFNYSRVYAGGKKIKVSDGTDKFLYVEKAGFAHRVYPFFINGIALNSVWGAAFRRETSENIRFDVKMRTAEDAAFAAEAYTAAESVLFTGEYLYCYYQSDGGLTGSGMSALRKLWCNFRLSAKLLRLLPRWGMDTPAWRARVLVRPFRVAADKLRRVKASPCTGELSGSAKLPD